MEQCPLHFLFSVLHFLFSFWLQITINQKMSKAEMLLEKRERIIIVHVSTPFQNEFLLLILITKFFCRNFQVSSNVVCLLCFFSAEECISSFLITSNKCKENLILYHLKLKCYVVSWTLQSAGTLVVCIWMTKISARGARVTL